MSNYNNGPIIDYKAYEDLKISSSYNRSYLNPFLGSHFH